MCESLRIILLWLSFDQRMIDYKLIDLSRDCDLTDLAAGASRIGIDTEFMREKTFFPQLCLIQVASSDEILCADPLRLDAAGCPLQEKLWAAIMQPRWILHSGRQDLEVLYAAAGRMPSELFDTQIAAALLGYQPQLGYANLVKTLFDVELAKTHTRADWSKRPLSDAVLQYAAEDVQYLLPACDILTDKLQALGRLEWALEDSSALLDPTLYSFDATSARQRLKGATNLRGQHRAIALALAEWRERRAVKSNRPRQWIMRDAQIVEIAAAAPKNEAALRQASDLSDRALAKISKRLLDVIATVDTSTDADQQVAAPRPNEHQKKTMKLLQKKVVEIAGQLNIAAELLAPRKELTAAVLGERDSRMFSGWRYKVIGESLLEIVNNA